MVETRILGQALAENADVVLRRAAPILRELDLHDGIHGAGVDRVGRGPIGRQADLGDDQLQVLWRNRLLDEVLDLRDHFFRLFDARAARGAGGDLESPESTSGKKSRRITGSSSASSTTARSEKPMAIVVTLWFSTTSRPRT